MYEAAHQLNDTLNIPNDNIWNLIREHFMLIIILVARSRDLVV